MKRSEREKELLIVIEDFWRRPWGDIPEVRPALAKVLVEAEMANGAKFDPEEPELPDVEHRPDGSFLLKSKRTGEVLGAGFTGKRSAELPLEVAEP